MQARPSCAYMCVCAQAKWKHSSVRDACMALMCKRVCVCVCAHAQATVLGGHLLNSSAASYSPHALHSTHAAQTRTRAGPNITTPRMHAHSTHEYTYDLIYTSEIKPGQTQPALAYKHNNEQLHIAPAGRCPYSALSATSRPHHWHSTARRCRHIAGGPWRQT